MSTYKENTYSYSIMLCFVLIILGLVAPSHAMTHHHTFVVTDTPYSRLCSNKSILTVNGQFPGPTVYVTEGDTISIKVINRARENITIHWHGVKQPRYPWSDGPEYVTQCPIEPGQTFNQKIVLSDEIGTLWWHAHSDWSRATVHGALVVKPRIKNDYPFPKPDKEIPIILGQWWKSDIQAVLSEFLQNGGGPNVSDALLINGQPGDLLPCSKQDTFKLTVEHGKRYLIRMVNAVMNNIMFVRLANHTVTVVGLDGAYTKPFKTDYIAISPGQTMDFLLEADQPPSHYYMAARVYETLPGYDNTTATAIIQYSGGNYTPPAAMRVPPLPAFNDTSAAVSFAGRLRGLSYKNHTIRVPRKVNKKLLFTLSINLLPCPANNSCAGLFGERMVASVNNITFQQPRVSILQAYYDRIRGVYGDDFPSMPPLRFNYTADMVPRDLWASRIGTEVRVLEYGDVVELVFQGTNIGGRGINHPMHLHGHSFYAVGSGFGNFNKSTDPLRYNLVDPPLVNTINVPISGWTAIRFTANNPGVWLMHCHFERHVSWGMDMVFITKNGRRPNERMHRPPKDFPRC